MVGLTGLCDLDPWGWQLSPVGEMKNEGCGVGVRVCARARARLGLVDSLRLSTRKFYISFSLSFMSAPQRPGYHSIDLSAPEGKNPLEGKDSLEVTDDLDRGASLSYTSHMPLNKNHPAQSATSIPPQHDISQSPADGEGLPPQVYHDSHPQSQQHTPSTRNSSWDLLGGARKLGEAYEHFDSRNASEQHLAFADGDLPDSKVKLIDTHWL